MISKGKFAAILSFYYTIKKASPVTGDRAADSVPGSSLFIFKNHAIKTAAGC
jgi:hypothetical protein